MKKALLCLGCLALFYVIIISSLQPILRHPIQNVQPSIASYEWTSHDFKNVSSQYLRTDRPYEGDAFASLVEKNSSNLPYKFWLKQLTVSKRVKCGKFPDIYSIKWSGDLWQIFQSKITQMYLLSAYINDRPKDASYVRVIGFIKQVRYKDTLNSR